ncbi:retinaldehyde-binding protein 1-like [Anopheles ziemanni]|uniref:retinaldehyde-binding protein 1-like n=1 Tax=Anopheles coustani TaxID=139045 RepID=UPI0026584B5B|nr:retinaldehyde-binding protein 1-like [Anopheles coustani]XP_058178536.1 retinaldehyde-binding protein 1-like [Anopheles ziemanni]
MSKLAAYSVDKKSQEYDEYQFTLPELFRDIAKEELREDDSVREQSLTEMRQWIANNENIWKCRTDAKFLLRFLRFQKFSVPMACEALERYLMMRETYPSWFQNLDSYDAAMKELYLDGSTSILGQDSAGRTVIFFRVARFVAEKVVPPKGGKFIALLLEAMLEWEEVQIGGLQLMVDYSDMDLAIFEKWSTSELRLIMDAYSRLYPLRFNDVHAAKLPKKAVPIVEMLLSFTDPKIRERINCYASVAEMQKHFEPAMVPNVYGGQVDLDILNQSVWSRIEQQRDVVLGMDNMEINLDHYAPIWDEMNVATLPADVSSA